MNHQINIVRIKAVANALDSLKDKVVFIGGATVSLYPDRKVFEVRPTDDIDVIIEIINYHERTELEEKLRSLGFSHDLESGIVCRYKVQGIIVDIMPTNDPSVGFKNRWYSEGFHEAISFTIDDKCTVKIMSAPYFIATKLEAFKGRGENDGRTSSDFEDIIYVLENRKTVWNELNSAKESVKEYLKSEFHKLLKTPTISEWIDCHVERGATLSTNLIIEELKKFVS